MLVTNKENNGEVDDVIICNSQKTLDNQAGWLILDRLFNSRLI